MVFIPTKDATKVPEDGTCKVNLPSSSVIVPMLVPLTEIVTAVSLSPVAAKVTVPLMVRCCEKELSEATTIK
jgi:hypothetical protein